MELETLKNIVAVTDCLIGNNDHEVFIDPFGINNYTVTETGVDIIHEFNSFNDMVDKLLIDGQPLKEAIVNMKLL